MTTDMAIPHSSAPPSKLQARCDVTFERWHQAENEAEEVAKVEGSWCREKHVELVGVA